jgi:transcriptional regulator with XRE-family HTH domain
MKEAVVMSQSLSERVSLAIRIEMVRQGLSVRELAERLGHPDTWLHRRLNGTTSIDVPDLERLSRELKVPVSLFFVDERRTEQGSAA